MNTLNQIDRVFLDTNVFVYLASAHDEKARVAADLLRDSTRPRSISTQVLSEFANAARRRIGLGWPEIRYLLGTIRETCSVEKILEADIETAIDLAQSLRYSWCDCLILAVAIRSGATILLTEDLQHGQVIGPLTIRNPFL